MKMNPSVCPPLRFLLLSTFLGLSWLIYKYGKYFVGWKLQRMKEMQIICWFDIINTKPGIFFLSSVTPTHFCSKDQEFSIYKDKCMVIYNLIHAMPTTYFQQKILSGRVKSLEFFLTNHPNNFKTFLKLTLKTTAS